jgi:hypothetical protein
MGAIIHKDDLELMRRFAIESKYTDVRCNGELLSRSGVEAR